MILRTEDSTFRQWMESEGRWKGKGFKELEEYAKQDSLIPPSGRSITSEGDNYFTWIAQRSSRLWTRISEDEMLLIKEAIVSGLYEILTTTYEYKQLFFPTIGLVVKKWRLPFPDPIIYGMDYKGPRSSTFHGKSGWSCEAQGRKLPDFCEEEMCVLRFDCRKYIKAKRRELDATILGRK